MPPTTARGGAGRAAARRYLVEPPPIVARFTPFAPAVAVLAVQQLWFPAPAGVLVRGAVIGGLTALIAVGMVLVYRANRVVSFAQGDLGTAPVVLAYLLVTAWGWPWLAAVGAGLASALLLGAVVEVVVIRRFRTEARLLLTVGTIGVAQVLAGVALVLPRLFDERLVAPRLEPPFDVTFTVSGTVFGAEDLLAMIAIPVTVALVALLLRGTSTGLALRAAADRADRASMVGVPVRRLNTLVWVLAAALAFEAVLLRAGVLGLPFGPVLSIGVLLRALAALMLGGLVRLPAVAASAVALGVLELAVANSASSPAVLDPILAAVIVGALLLRRGGSARDEAASWRLTQDAPVVRREIARLPAVRATRAATLALVAVGAIVLPHLLAVDRSLKASALVIYAILGLSFVVLTGWAGQLSLGQIGLFALGSAIGAKATLDWGLDLSAALVVSAVAGALAAVAIGFPALRLRGLDLAVVTLAASLAVSSWLLNGRFFDWVPDGRIERPPLFGSISLESATSIYYIALAVLVLLLIGLRGVRASRTGRALLALRDNERAAQAYALPPVRLRLTAFALSGAIASIAGCLFAHHQQAIAVLPFGPEQNLAVFTMVVVGGIVSPLGAVLGALWYQGIRWFLPVEWQFLASGLGVVAILLVVPGGIGNLVLRLRRRLFEGFGRQRQPTDAAAASVTSPPASGDVPSGSSHEIITRSRADGAGAVAGEPLALAVDGLCAGYDGRAVVEDIDIRLAPGEIVALLGTNGAGKSTVLNAICGVVAKYGGRVAIGGRDMTAAAPHEIAAAGVAIVPGGAGVFPSLTVAENLRMAAWLRRRQAGAADEAAAAACRAFPFLQARAGELAGDLSGGQQQQLALAMAFVAQPRVLLVDELSLGLAPVVVTGLLELVRDASDAGTAIVVVEQSADVALSVADTAMFLERGRIRFEGPARELRDRDDLLRAIFLPEAVHSVERVASSRPAGSRDLPPALETIGVTRSFGGIRAVDDVSIAVAPGEIVGLIGPNGAGKTTLLDLLCGYTSIEHGDVQLGGRSITSLAPHRRAMRGLGRTFQDGRLFGGLTVDEAIAVACERFVAVRDPLSAALRLPNSYDSERTVRRRVDELTELLSLDEHRDVLVRELSTGTRRIAELACVLAHRPSVVLLDEPSAGVAQAEIEALAALLERIRGETGASLVVVEHDIPLVRAVVDRIVALDQGHVVTDGAPDAVLTHPDVVMAYLGTPAVTRDAQPVPQEA